MLLPALMVGGLGTGLFNPAVSAVALGSAPPEQSGLAAGVNDTFRQAGIAVGVALFGALIPGSAALGQGSAESFVSGMHTALIVGAVMAGIGAIACVKLIPVLRTGGYRRAAPGTEPARGSRLVRPEKGRARRGLTLPVEHGPRPHREPDEQGGGQQDEPRPGRGRVEAVRDRPRRPAALHDLFVPTVGKGDSEPVHEQHRQVHRQRSSSGAPGDRTQRAHQHDRRDREEHAVDALVVAEMHGPEVRIARLCNDLLGHEQQAEPRDVSGVVAEVGEQPGDREEQDRHEDPVQATAVLVRGRRSPLPVVARTYIVTPKAIATPTAAGALTYLASRWLLCCAPGHAIVTQRPTDTTDAITTTRAGRRECGLARKRSTETAMSGIAASATGQPSRTTTRPAAETIPWPWNP